MNARYYLPAIGRFLTPDTLVPTNSVSQSLNRYSFAINQPMLVTDPSGHCFVPLFAILCLTLGVLTVAAHHYYNVVEVPNLEANPVSSQETVNIMSLSVSTNAGLGYGGTIQEGTMYHFGDELYANYHCECSGTTTPNAGLNVIEVGLGKTDFVTNPINNASQVAGGLSLSDNFSIGMYGYSQTTSASIRQINPSPVSVDHDTPGTTLQTLTLGFSLAPMNYAHNACMCFVEEIGTFTDLSWLNQTILKAVSSHFSQNISPD